MLSDFAYIVLKQSYYHQPSPGTNMKINEEKYIDLIMYILFRCSGKPNLGKTVLCTVMYFIDFNYYEIYEEFFTKETYIKSKRGIKPKHFRRITEELIAKKQLFLRKEPYYNRIIHKYYPTVIPTLTFSQKELVVINSCINSLTDNNASTITKYAWQDKPIRKTELNDEINYEYVFLRGNK